MKKLIIIFSIFMLITQSQSQAAFWNKGGNNDANGVSQEQGSLGNNLKQDEYPDSKDVEPKVDGATVIKGGVENTLDINLEECLKFALGNNPRIQAAMQDVFASDARIRQAWASYFPQFSWQTGYTNNFNCQMRWVETWYSTTGFLVKLVHLKCFMTLV